VRPASLNPSLTTCHWSGIGNRSSWQSLRRDVDSLSPSQAGKSAQRNRRRAKAIAIPQHILQRRGLQVNHSLFHAD